MTTYYVDIRECFSGQWLVQRYSEQDRESYPLDREYRPTLELARERAREWIAEMKAFEAFIPYTETIRGDD
jgi:hypothetical protein